MAKIEIIEMALAKTKEQKSHLQSDPLLALIESQLSYLRKVLTGKRPNRFRTARINLGYFGPLYFSKRDPAYAELLIQSQKVADSLPKQS